MRPRKPPNGMELGMQAGTSFLHEFLKGDEFLSEQLPSLDESGCGRIPNFCDTVLVPGPEEKTHVGPLEERMGTWIQTRTLF